MTIATPTVAGCTPADKQRREALQRANKVRSELCECKRRMRSGDLTLTDVVTNQPAPLRNIPLVDIIRWTMRTPGPTLTEIGKRAVRDNINLMVPLGRASALSRAWVAEHGTYRWLPSR
jgi:hypothetical protein